MRGRTWLLLVLSVCCLPSQASAAISVTFADTQSQAFAGLIPGGQIISDSKSLTGYSAVASDLPSSSTTSSVYSVSPGDANFSATFDQVRSGDPHAISLGSTQVNFTVTAATPYSIAGLFTGSAPSVFSQMGLYDDKNNALIVQIGDLPSGSTTGALLPGDYTWFTYVYLQSADTILGDNGATSHGFAELTLGYPEPASLVIWSLFGAIGLGIGWWRRMRTAESLA